MGGWIWWVDRWVDRWVDGRVDGWVVVVCPQDFCVSPWHFDNGASSKIDEILAEDGGLLNVLPLAVHLNFF